MELKKKRIIKKKRNVFERLSRVKANATAVEEPDSYSKTTVIAAKNKKITLNLSNLRPSKSILAPPELLEDIKQEVSDYDKAKTQKIKNKQKETFSCSTFAEKPSIRTSNKPSRDFGSIRPSRKNSEGIRESDEFK